VWSMLKAIIQGRLTPSRLVSPTGERISSTTGKLRDDVVAYFRDLPSDTSRWRIFIDLQILFLKKGGLGPRLIALCVLMAITAVPFCGLLAHKLMDRGAQRMTDKILPPPPQPELQKPEPPKQTVADPPVALPPQIIPVVGYESSVSTRSANDLECELKLKALESATSHITFYVRAPRDVYSLGQPIVMNPADEQDGMGIVVTRVSSTVDRWMVRLMAKDQVLIIHYSIKLRPASPSNAAFRLEPTDPTKRIALKSLSASGSQLDNAHAPPEYEDMYGWILASPANGVAANVVPRFLGRNDSSPYSSPELEVELSEFGSLGLTDFSDSQSNVFVDALGRIHLRMTPQNGAWYGAEVISNNVMVNGTYRFFLDSPTTGIDCNVFPRFFTWNNGPLCAHREADVELLKFGNSSDTNSAQFVVQPYKTSGNLVHSVPVTSGTMTTTESLPHGLALVSMAGTGWTCVGYSCTRSDSLPGSSSYPGISVLMNVDDNANSPLVNVVSVSGGGFAPMVSTGSTTIAPNLPALKIAVTHTGSFAQGQVNDMYSVSVTNQNGAASASAAVNVTESLPLGMPLNSMSVSGWSCSGNTCTRSDTILLSANYPVLTVKVNVLNNTVWSQVNMVSQRLVTPDQANRNLAPIYEAAATVLALLRRDQPDDLTAAFNGVNALDYTLRHESYGDPLPGAPEGSVELHNAYFAGDIGTLNTQSSAWGSMAGDIRLEGLFTDKVTCSPNGFCLVLESATGSNKASAVLAITNLLSLNDAETIGNWIAPMLTGQGPTGAAKTVTVTNRGANILPVTVRASGAFNGDFAQTNNCGAISSANSCTISVVLKASGIGMLKASLLIIDSAGDSPQTVLLSGVGSSSCTTIADCEYQLLNQRVSASQNALYVYKDADSGENKGFPSGLFGQNIDLSSVSIDSACIDSPLSGTGCSSDPTALDATRGTVLRISFPQLPDMSFVGLNIQDPQNYVPNAVVGNGYNLTPATALQFDVRSPNSFTQVQFGVGGCLTQYYTLDLQWTPMTIPLNSLSCVPDLSNLHILFSVQTDYLHASAGAVVLLDNIRFAPVPGRQSTVAALSLPVSTQTFGSLSAQHLLISPDQVNRNLATVREVAQTVLALLTRDQSQDVANALRMADTLEYALYHHNHGVPIPKSPGSTDGCYGGTRSSQCGLHNAYVDGDIAFLNDRPDPLLGKAGDVRFGGFSVGTSLCGPSSYCLVLDGASGGNNTVSILAFLAAYRRTGNTNYLDDATAVANWIVANLADTSGSVYAGYNDGGLPKSLIPGKSTVDNALIFGALNILSQVNATSGRASDAAKCAAQARSASNFVVKMFDTQNRRLVAVTVPMRRAEVLNQLDSLDSDTTAVLALAGVDSHRNVDDATNCNVCIVAKFSDTSASASQIQPLSVDIVNDGGARLLVDTIIGTGLPQNTMWPVRSVAPLMVTVTDPGGAKLSVTSTVRKRSFMPQLDLDARSRRSVLKRPVSMRFK
jgi:hypothetical protein